MNTAYYQKRHRKHTDKYKSDIVDLVNKLNLSDDEEIYFNKIVTSIGILDHEEFDQKYVGITNKYY